MGLQFLNWYISIRMFNNSHDGKFVYFYFKMSGHYKVWKTTWYYIFYSKLFIIFDGYVAFTILIGNNRLLIIDFLLPI